MSPTATLGAYAAALALVFAAAFGVGKAVGPVGTVEPAPRHDSVADQHDADQHSS